MAKRRELTYTRRERLERKKPGPTAKARAKRRRQLRPLIKSVRAQVVDRACGFCENCGTPCRQSGEAHHKIHRSQGGKWTLDNIVFLCRTCHGLQHGVRR